MSAHLGKAGRPSASETGPSPPTGGDPGELNHTRGCRDEFERPPPPREDDGETSGDEYEQDLPEVGSGSQSSTQGARKPSAAGSASTKKPASRSP
jgi:hypothetical protein